MQLRHGGQCCSSSIPASSVFGVHSSHFIAAGRRRRRRSFVVRVAVVDTDNWDSEDIQAAGLALEDSLAAAGSDADNYRADRVLELVQAIEGRRGRQRTAPLELQLDIDQSWVELLLQALQKWEASELASSAMSPEIVDSTGCC